MRECFLRHAFNNFCMRKKNVFELYLDELLRKMLQTRLIFSSQLVGIQMFSSTDDLSKSNRNNPNHPKSSQSTEIYSINDGLQ